MKSNRFDYLELGDQTEQPLLNQEQEDAPVNLTIPSSPTGDANQASQRARADIAIPGITPVRRKDPPRLAEVRVDETGERFLPPDPASPKPWAVGVTKKLKPVEVFGSRGDKAGEFNFPTGLAVDKTGIVWVADSYNHRLQRITPDGGVASVGTRGLGRGQFMMPMDVAVDDQRAFYVVEQGGHRVQKFSSEGVLELVIGRSGSRPGEMRSPMGITVNEITGEILVADTGNSRVQRFDRNGQFAGIFGEGELAGPTAVSNPQAIASDADGRVYVADTMARRVLQFDPLGRLLGYYGGPIGPGQRVGSTSIDLNEARSLACTESGTLFIGDVHRGAGRITAIATDTGNVDAAVGSVGKTLGLLSRPGGLAVTPEVFSGSDVRDVYLSDTMNHRIIRFAWR